MANAKQSSRYSGVNFKTSNLAADRERGMSTHAAAAEIETLARQQGRDITRKPGRRQPTERYVDGKGWVKV